MKKIFFMLSFILLNIFILTSCSGEQKSDVIKVNRTRTNFIVAGSETNLPSMAKVVEGYEEKWINRDTLCWYRDCPRRKLFSTE